MLIRSRKANIGFSIWEAKRSLDITRSGDWAVGLHWALPMLEEVLPRDLFARLQEAGTDPFQPTPDSSFVPILNSETGELLTKTKLPKTYRLSCKKLRALCSEGLNVQVWNWILNGGFMTMLNLHKVWQATQRSLYLRG